MDFFPETLSTPGKTEEYYVANEYVTPGTYFVIVNVYSTESSSDEATVRVYYRDPVEGVDDWRLWGRKKMSLKDPTTPYITDVDALSDLNDFNNWFYPNAIQRRDSEGEGVNFNGAIQLPSSKVKMLINNILKSSGPARR